MRKVAILGSTGSIGLQTLEVIKEHSEDFQVVALSCFSNVEPLIEQIKQFNPTHVCVGDITKKNNIAQNNTEKCHIYWGNEGLLQMIDEIDVDIYVIAIVGFAGLKPTFHAIKKNKTVALANKESLVVAGKILMDLVHKNNTLLYPIDSEHSAILQSLQGENYETIEKIILTASGGPFRTYTREQLKKVTPEDAVQHPNWKMGDKITIDSATMINKGFELIEAKWLFGVDIDKIEILVHPQSIVHSAVQFTDGAVKAQLGVPDMRLPIQYALFYPTRKISSINRIDWINLALTFEKPDINKFKCLDLAIQAIKQGGNMPCVLNAANEIANESFRHKKCGFSQIAETIAYALNHMSYSVEPSLDDLIITHQETIKLATTYLKDISL